jgi:hypothetical protein
MLQRNMEATMTYWEENQALSNTKYHECTIPTIPFILFKIWAYTHKLTKTYGGRTDKGTLLYSLVIRVIKTNNAYRKMSMSQVHYIFQ